MKKFFNVSAMAVVFVLTTVFCQAQMKIYEGVAPGKTIVGLRLGLPNTAGANFTYEYALARVWKGTFTIGGQLGYMWEGRTEGGELGPLEKWQDNKLDFKLRTTYRLCVLVPEWEAYAGVGIGGGVAITKKTVWAELRDFEEYFSRGFVSGAFILGTTYNITRQFGVNFEVDFGPFEQAWLNLGLNYNF